jgi:hypothetical protein
MISTAALPFYCDGLGSLPRHLGTEYEHGAAAFFDLANGVSRHRHDQSVDAAIPGAFVSGPLMAVTAVIMIVGVRSHRTY